MCFSYMMSLEAFFRSSVGISNSAANAFASFSRMSRSNPGACGPAFPRRDRSSEGWYDELPLPKNGERRPRPRAGALSRTIAFGEAIPFRPLRARTARASTKSPKATVQRRGSAWGFFRRVLEQGGYVVLRTELPILVGQKVTVVPPAFHLASIIIRYALILDTPRFGFVDSLA